MVKLVISAEAKQPGLLSYENDNEFTVVIGGLALGGAERIVLDWARRIYPKWKVHLIVLRDHPQEWPVPAEIKITRLNNTNIIDNLKQIGKQVAVSSNPTVLCHLLKEHERNALAHFGAMVVPVLHNAKQGWLEHSASIKSASSVIAVSEACRKELDNIGWPGATSVIRHIPPVRKFSPTAREHYRRQWNIPLNAKVIGMVGAVKPQKNYSFALHILTELNKTEPTYLVILGGPIGKNGRSAWMEIMSDIGLLNIRNRVAMPGFIADAMRCLPAFDCILNTSHYEGFSMATTEALINGMPVIASNVGGQGEMLSEGLTLIDADDTLADWTAAIKAVIGKQYASPTWASFPSYRLWTLASLAHTFKASAKILFITANLNSGGAQRSLVNLATHLSENLSFDIAVTGNSTADYFFNELTQAGISVFRSHETRDAFDHAEVLVKKIAGDKIGTVCFWNLDSKIKLLLVKTLQFTSVKFVDVSPGNNSFDELESTLQFQHMIAFREPEYYARLNTIVLKYNGLPHALCEDKTLVIKNGIPQPRNVKTNYAVKGNPRIVVSGRITPNKFSKEIIYAMDNVWQLFPTAELHFYGAAEAKVADYATEVTALAGDNIDKRIFFHGMNFTVQSQLYLFDAYVVLGKDQGCPNALLEALAVGLPAVGNDNGGTCEQLINGRTGILIDDNDPAMLSEALIKLLSDRAFAEKVGKAAKAHVLQEFSMKKMVQNYLTLLAGKKTPGKKTINKKIISN